MLDDRQLDTALSTIVPVTKEGIGTRAIRNKYIKEPLSCKGSLISGGRYNPPKELLQIMNLPLKGALYISSSLDVSLSEVGAKSTSSLAYFNITYNLSAVLDLTNSENLLTLGTSYQELTGNWRETNDEIKEFSPTQRLGLAIIRSRKFDSIKFHSSKTSIGNNYNLAIFIDEVNKDIIIEEKTIYLKAELVQV